MDYSIVMADTVPSLLRKTRVVLKAGWEPLGGPFYDNKLYYQAVIRRKVG